MDQVAVHIIYVWYKATLTNILGKIVRRVKNITALNDFKVMFLMFLIQIVLKFIIYYVIIVQRFR